MLKKSNIFCLLFLYLASVLHAQVKTIPYQELPDYQGITPGSGMFFGASMNSNSITVTFAGPSDRWLSFGLGTAMYNTDVFVYSNGKLGALHALGWSDYYNTSISVTNVNKDTVQDWVIVSTGTVSSGQRTVVATRALNTGDANDVSVNFNASALNLVWARGATSTNTLAYHGGQNKAHGISLLWLTPPVPSFTTGTNNVCAGSSVTFSNLTTGGQASYTWSFAGGTPATSTATNPTVIYNSPGVYSVSLTGSNVIASATVSQINYITVFPVVVPFINIISVGGGNPICAGSVATFSAIAGNGGSSPVFQWKVNGTNVGTNSSSFASSALPSQALVSCLMTSNATCASPATVTSSAITLTVNSTVSASASITISSGNNPMCAGAQTGFSVASTNTGSAPIYQWQINGLFTGINATVFTSNALANGDVVNCILNSNSPCASSTIGVSAGITMTVGSVFIPSVFVSQVSGVNPFCAGSNVSFSASAINGGNIPLYQWKINGLNVGSSVAAYSAAGLSNGDVVTCLMTSALGCASPNTATSSALTVTVINLPATPTISAIGSLTLCANSNVVLISSALIGNNWSNGASSQTILVNTTGTFFVSQTTNGCSSLPSLPKIISVNPLPMVTLSAINNVCVSSEPFFLANGFPANGTYTVNGVESNEFLPAAAGIGTTVILYAHTDLNNCTNTASIQIIIDACLGLDDLGLDNSGLIVFPNPSSGKITLEAKKEKINLVSITDVNGKIIFQKKYKNESVVFIDLSLEMVGNYLMNITLQKSNFKVKIIRKD